MKKEIRIALVTIFALVVLFFGLNFLKGVVMFSDSSVYYVTFQNVAGVTKNTPVFADGVQVGIVTAISYDYTHEKPTTVELSLDKEMRLPLGSSAEVKSDLMGNCQVNLLLANNMRERIEPGSTFPGSDEEAMTQKLARMLPAAEQMVPKLDSILTNLALITSNPAINGTLNNAEQLTTQLNQTAKSLNTLMGELNKNVPGLMTQTGEVLTDVKMLSANLSELNVANTMENVDQTLQKLQASLDKLNSNDGTLGRLLNDPAVFDELYTTISDADSLLTDLKQNPKRYVHFSIFGRKK